MLKDRVDIEIENKAVVSLAERQGSNIGVDAATLSNLAPGLRWRAVRHLLSDEQPMPQK